MISNLNDSELIKVFVALVTGGGFVGWYRENRRSRKDAYGFAIELLKQQTIELASERARVDQLIVDMADLKAQHSLANETLAILRAENQSLKNECKRLQRELDDINKRSN